MLKHIIIFILTFLMLLLKAGAATPAQRAATQRPEAAAQETATAAPDADDNEGERVPVRQPSSTPAARPSPTPTPAPTRKPVPESNEGIVVPP